LTFSGRFILGNEEIIKPDSKIKIYYVSFHIIGKKYLSDYKYKGSTGIYII
jgi:hypothetical protein